MAILRTAGRLEERSRRRLDLVHGTGRVAVVTDHVPRDGLSKLVSACTFPLTGTAMLELKPGEKSLSAMCIGVGQDIAIALEAL